MNELRGAKPVVHLRDYRAPAWRTESIDLAFDLDVHETIVEARLHLHQDPARADEALRLDGEALDLIEVELDGVVLGAGDYRVDARGLELPQARGEARVRTRVRLRPDANTALEGLYLSGSREHGFLLTQCEAEGFRRITYAQDRPDVLAVYRVALRAARERFPVLLAGGNPDGSGETPDGRHWARFVDPQPKPSYLFALAAGRLHALEDRFRTGEGRDVRLCLWTEADALARCTHAMRCLKAAFAWDEQRFGRHYQLDAFHIVATPDFTMGAMENTGLNIFNSKYLLTDPEHATDEDYRHVLAVVGHEYFHNWTGNRITCRDWFQLCLKEGLTVYREQEFSADQRSRPVQRIKDVKRLRARQFGEDAGPLAHPVRPSSYQKIDNFYTATVYEKGGEVIRMLKRIVGKDAFERGMQLYFERRDGTASTVEDFIGCFEQASGRKLDDFMRWYEQAGTPALKVRGAYDAATRSYELTISQRIPPTPGQNVKQPVPIPLEIGFIAPDGAIVAAKIEGDAISRLQHHVVITEAETTLRFSDVMEEPIPSVLRGFSAPVALDDGLGVEQRLAQMAHDPDAFTRWEAGQTIARAIMLGEVKNAAPALAAALGRELDRAQEDPAFAALALRLPDLNELILAAAAPDPEQLFAAREELRRTVATALRERLEPIARAPSEVPFSPGAEAAGRRALKAAALDLLAALGPQQAQSFADAFDSARSMTETIAALEAMGASGADGFDDALTRFYQRWSANPLVIDKWFAVQASAPRPDALARAERLRAHPDFNLKNPNRVRSLAAAFAMRNPRAFHAADGGGYRFLAGLAEQIDPLNPALAARLLTAFELWKRFDAGRQAHAKAALEHLAALTNLSKNTREMVERTLA